MARDRERVTLLIATASQSSPSSDLAHLYCSLRHCILSSNYWEASRLVTTSLPPSCPTLELEDNCWAPATVSILQRPHTATATPRTLTLPSTSSPTSQQQPHHPPPSPPPPPPHQFDKVNKQMCKTVRHYTTHSSLSYFCWWLKKYYVFFYISVVIKSFIWIYITFP